MTIQKEVIKYLHYLKTYIYPSCQTAQKGLQAKDKVKTISQECECMIKSPKYANEIMRTQQTSADKSKETCSYHLKTHDLSGK